jgi:hypothetical protein
MDRTNGTQDGPQHAPSELQSQPAAIKSPAKRRLRTFKLRVMNVSQLLQQANPLSDSPLEQEQPPTPISETIFGLLSKKSLAKIRATKAAAIAELLAELSRYWESLPATSEALKQHDGTVTLRYRRRRIGPEVC